MPNILAILVVLAGANSSEPEGPVAAPEFRSEPLPTPASASSRLPNLCTGPDGRIRLSWVEETESGPTGKAATLKLSQLDGNRWSTPDVVASGSGWFVNWADFPAVVSLESNHLLAHFLEKSGAGSYDYHVRIVRSSDGGKIWSQAERLHSHDGEGEHGFVSFVPLGSATAAAVWLDGRNAGQHGDEAASGAMCLYARSVSASGDLGPEALLDDRVCDCCPTAAVQAPDGALVVAYRDRSADEVRDISVVRWKEGRILDPAWSSRDGWKIAGCPVNGPALDLAGDRIGIAWFTLGSQGQSRVSCAFSKDGGRSFSVPSTLASEGAAGRVDAVFDGHGRFIVSWLESEGESVRWRVARVDPVSGLPLDVNTVVATVGGRESGLGRVARDREGIVFAWTEVGETSQVSLRRLLWD